MKMNENLFAYGLLISLFHMKKLLCEHQKGSNCKCKDFINQNNVGNCKGKKPSQFQRKFFACYVDQPSSCTDLKDSGTNPGEQLSVNACLLRNSQTKHEQERHCCKRSGISSSCIPFCREILDGDINGYIEVQLGRIIDILMCSHQIENAKNNCTRSFISTRLTDEFGDSTKYQQDIFFKDERQKWRNPSWRCCEKSGVPANCLGMCIENANRNKKHHVQNNDIQRGVKIGSCKKYRNSIETCRNSIKAPPDAEMVSKCIDSELENVTSLEAMVKSGWEIDLNSWFNKSNSGIENQIYAKVCGYHTFWGYKYGTASGSVSASLKGTGIATLDFGSCGDSGITAVYLKRPFLNYVRLAIAEGSKRELSKIVSFSYEPGYIIKIEEEQTGIIKINSLKLRCN